jgi:hypothetical protein
MANPTIRIHDLETNEVIDREMTDAEFAIYQEEQAAAQLESQAQGAKAHERAALLERLGITEEEARLLLGGN